MKYLFYYLLLIFAINAVSAQSILTSKNLLVHFTFDKKQTKRGTILTDKSKQGNNGEYIGSLDYDTDRFGNDCSAALFDGVSNYVSVANSPQLQAITNEFSVAVWFKLAADATPYTQWLTLCSKGTDRAESDESPQFRVQATLETISMSTDFTEKLLQRLKPEKWYFYAVTYDGEKAKVYLNDDLIFNFDYNKSFTPNAEAFEIGRDMPGKIEFFKGAMDDFRLYNKAITETDVQDLYNDATSKKKVNPCDTLEKTVVIAPPPPKKDTTKSRPVVIIKPPRKDSVKTTSDYDELPKDIEGTPVEYQRTIVVHSKNIKICFYDDDKADGDSVSVNLNGIWVLEDHLLANKSPVMKQNKVVKCTLNSKDKNYLVSRAWNLGKYPPNTLAIDVDDGVAVKTYKIHSKIGLSGGIKIVYEP
ncbi:MAG: hypothetical protein RI894_1724 [Bacteroidota bacterium]|jgi:hypothetical protein